MYSLLSKKQPNTSSQVGEKKLAEEQQEKDGGVVSSHLYLKPAHTTGTLDKAVVLRRIRHRKRVNKMKSAVRTLLSSPFAPHADADGNEALLPPIRWADDAFAAP